MRLITGTEVRARALDLIATTRRDLGLSPGSTPSSHELKADWLSSFAECKLCRRVYPHSTASLETKRCDECKCSVCYRCDCSVYHLAYRLSLLDQLEETQEKAEQSKASAKRSKRAKKKQKAKEKRIKAKEAAEQEE